MAVRRDRRDVAPTRVALEDAYPHATSKLAVFLHGLAENEESWRLHADHGGRSSSTYGSRLAEDFGYSPLYLRYNSGLPIAENGRRLTALLEELVGAWPAPVDEVVLVGHSMGGLVARSACHYGAQARRSWVTKVAHVFYLGSPHLGAGIEQWVSRLTGVLGGLTEARPVASVLERRSAGIKDLRAGHLVDHDESETGPGGRLSGTEVPLLPWANHYTVSATITRNRRNPLGRLIGDLLVQPASARGRARDGRHIPFPVEHARHFGGLHHFDLLNHPSVYEAMRDWLGPSHRDRHGLAAAN